MALTKVTTTGIADDSITSAKVASGVISVADVADGAFSPRSKVLLPGNRIGKVDVAVQDHAATPAIVVELECRRLGV